MNLIELVAAAFGLICVWLTARQDIRCWPAGLVQVSLYIFVFYMERLYSDVLLHAVYVVLQLYGWHQWLRGGPRDSGLVVTRWSRAHAIGWTIAAALGTFSLGFAMRRFTNAALPYWDASIAVLSLIAQFLLARKVLENWLIWIVVDIIAIGVYSRRSLIVTAGLYAVFLCISARGYVLWKRSMAAENLTQSYLGGGNDR